MSEPRRGALLSQSAVVVVATAISAALSAVLALVLPWLMGPAEYGVVTAALALNYIAALVQGLVENGITRNAAQLHVTADREALGALVRAGLRALARPLLVLTAVASLASPWLSRGLNLGNVPAFLGAVAFTALSVLVCVPRGVLRGDHRFVALGANQVLESVVRGLLGVGVVALGAGAAGGVAGYAAGMAAAFVFGLWQLRDLRGGAAVELPSRKVFDSAGPIFFLYVYTTFLTNIDMLVARRVLDPIEAGRYGAAGGIARMMATAAMPLYQLLFTRVTALKAAGKDVRRLTVMALGVMAAGFALSFALPWFAGTWILSLQGKDFVTSPTTLRLLWLTTSALSFETAVVFVLIGASQVRGAVWFVAPCALMSLLLLRFHGSGVQIALCGLAGVLAGGVLVAALVATTLRRSPGS